MEKEKSSNTTHKGNRPPKNVVFENNSQAQQAPKNEFCSLYSYSSLNRCNYYFGMNIFDLYKPEELTELVRNPMLNNKQLRDLSLMLYGTNGSYTNVVDYMTSMPTLSNIIVPHGESEKKKARNKKLMSATLKAIKDKELIRDALFKGMVEGLAFYYFETTAMPNSQRRFLDDFDVNSLWEINDVGINASVIPLPVDYTRIVGRKNSCYVIAFNLDYFTIDSVEPVERRLKKFPKEIRDAYAKYSNGKQSAKDTGNWVILDSSKTIVHKIRSKMDEPFGRPLVLAAIADILYRDYFVDTKRGVLDDLNNRIVYQTFPEGKDKGTSALTQKQQETQHNAVKKAVINKNNRGGISFFSVAAGTKINALDTTNTDIFDEKNESNLDDKISLALGFAGNALSGTGSGSYAAQESNLELVTSQIFQWVEQIENEINKCINENIIKDRKNPVEVKYLPITHLNKKSMVGYAKELYLQGCGSLSLWIAATGVSLEAYYALLDEEIDAGIYDKYKPHATSFNTSGKEAGRPTTDEPSEKTIASRSNRGNDLPSPSDN